MYYHHRQLRRQLAPRPHIPTRPHRNPRNNNRFRLSSRRRTLRRGPLARHHPHRTPPHRLLLAVLVANQTLPHTVRADLGHLIAIIAGLTKSHINLPITASTGFGIRRATNTLTTRVDKGVAPPLT